MRSIINVSWRLRDWQSGTGGWLDLIKKTRDKNVNLGSVTPYNGPKYAIFT